MANVGKMRRAHIFEGARGAGRGTAAAAAAADMEMIIESCSGWHEINLAKR